MDMKKAFKYLIEHRVKRSKDHTAVAAQLAPLEEQHKIDAARAGTAGGELIRPVVQESGAIIIDSEGLSLSNDIAEGGHGKQILGMEPVVLVILGFMLVFIAFIAWQISLMPTE
jgi:hypothetical protein